jgi:hypothetical protein
MAATTGPSPNYLLTPNLSSPNPTILSYNMPERFYRKAQNGNRKKAATDQIIKS